MLVALIVAFEEAESDPAVAENVTDVCPAAIVTDDGTVSDELDEVKKIRSVSRAKEMVSFMLETAEAIKRAGVATISAVRSIPIQ